MPSLYEAAKLNPHLLMRHSPALKTPSSNNSVNELVKLFKKNTVSETQEFLEKRGKEFLVEMTGSNCLQTLGYKYKSILEVALTRMPSRENIDEIDLLVLKYYVDHSQQAKETNMNLLHVLARNGKYDLIDSQATLHPEMLTERNEGSVRNEPCRNGY